MKKAHKAHRSYERNTDPNHITLAGQDHLWGPLPQRDDPARLTPDARAVPLI